MRSVPSGSFLRLSSPEALWRAYRRYQVGKLRTPAVARFHLDADLLLDLSQALRQGLYEPQAYVLKVIRDPKTDLIAAAPVIDRVVYPEPRMLTQR